MIFENQPVKLTSTIKDGGVAVDITGGTAKYRYWEPGVSGTPSGEYAATILDAEAGTIEYDIPRDILTVGVWSFRGIIEFANGIFPADKVETITVKAINI